MNRIDNQVCALRELALAKLAFDRAQQEFLRALSPDNQPLSDDKLHLIEREMDNFYDTEPATEPQSLGSEHLERFTRITALDC